MKFIISTQELNFLISKCQNAVAQKPTMPILSNLLVEAKNGYLTLTGTDLTVGIRCFTEAKILEEGATTLPAKKLGSLVRELTAVNIEVSTTENHVTEILADSSKFRLNGMSGNEFPPLPDLADAASFKIPQERLKEMFFRTSFAVSRDDNRFALTGVFFHVENGQACFFGADGRRLARSKVGIACDPTLSCSCIVPLKAVEEIQKILTDEGDATLYLLPDKIGVETEQSLLISKLLAADYPDVSRVIPEKSEAVISLHREELITLLRQVSLFAASQNHPVKFSFSQGELKLSANTTEVGEGRVSMPVNYHGAPLDIAFDPLFFLDVLKHTRGERVALGLNDSFNPGVITDELSEGESGASSLFVLMPMRFVT